VVATCCRSVLNFFDQTPRHQAGRKELYSVVVHASQKFFAVVIDETNIRQINQYRDLIGWTRLPALVQFVDATSRQLAFEKKPRR
jgi:hypothetical protein